MRQVVDGLYHIQAMIDTADSVQVFGPQQVFQVFSDVKGEA
jgi:hypothetical protein